MQEIIDSNVSLSRWPFRRLELDESPALVQRLRARGVIQAWAGSFDALLHKDVGGVNLRLADECQKSKGFLLPFGAINPKLPDWEEDLRRCHEEFKMPGIRLHPNYHGYKLDDVSFSALLKQATERGLIVQLAVIMEDRRTQHPLVQVPPVDLNPLPKLLKQVPGARIQLLNALQTLHGPLLLSVMAAGEVFFEIATIEGVGGVGNLIKQLPASRVLFGSHAPFFIVESALLKMKESPLTDQQSAAIYRDNAKRLLAHAGKTAP